MKYYSKVFNKITQCAQKVFEAATAVTARLLKQAAAQHSEEAKATDKPTLEARAQYVEFQNHLHEVAGKHNKFLEFVHVYVAAMASSKQHKMTKHLNNMCRRTIDLLQHIGKFCHADAEAENSGMELTEAPLRHSLNSDLMKFLIWSLSKIAHSFIKIREVTEKKDEEFATHQNLLKSKLLSGGIENRFLSCFCKETCQTIENLAEITGDKKLIQYLTKAELIDEDEVLLSIIHEGRDKSIDKLLDLLQWNLLRKNLAAKAGGKEGMAVARCAFAAILSLNQHEESCSYTNFVMMVDQLEMSLYSADDSMTENQKNKMAMEELLELGNIKPILDRWDTASKMRIWLQEKRKDISNSVKKKVEAEYKKREDDRALQEIQEKTAHEHEQDSKQQHDEETIDTTSKAGSQKQDSSMQDEITKREEEQVAQLLKKVSDKAELLIKLATPASWDQPDSSNKNLRNITGYNETEAETGEDSLRAKLQKIKSIQASQGTITSFENLSNKAVFNSCASSVLACLQCSIPAKKILSSIESKYINAMKRYCGLKIMGDLASCYMSDESKISCFNWF
mmetsp:Transcript_42159/g.48927  ORF Transcript_42159/g.48927 Transcript_42159/m.48927 type:complete len:566 (+) Transcript_42159:2966-4663(+)